MLQKAQRLKIGSFLSHYQIIRLVGEGGMGEVYEAQDTILNRRVALKVISPEASDSREILQRFKAEGQTLARLSHQNVVAVHALGEDQGIFYLVMEFIDGSCLNDLIELKGYLQVEEALLYFKQLLQGVLVLHELGIIHRDIKPRNIIIRKDNSLKIVDFGIAKIQKREEQSLTQHGQLLGSIYYLAPEVINGKEASFQSDIWSLGINLFEILTGKKPFEAKKWTALVDKIIADPIHFGDELSPSVPNQLQIIILKMCAKEPAQRYGSVKEILFDFEAFQMKQDDAVVFNSRPPQVPALRTRTSSSIRTKKSWHHNLPEWLMGGALVISSILIVQKARHKSVGVSESAVPTSTSPAAARITSLCLPIAPIGDQVLWLTEQSTSQFEWSGDCGAGNSPEISRDSDFHEILWQSSRSESPIALSSLANLGLTDGYYFWRLIRKSETNDSQVSLEPIRFQLVSSRSPNVLSPTSGEVHGVSEAVYFYWQEKPNVKFYRLQIAGDVNFQGLLEEHVSKETSFQFSIPHQGLYYWRVRGEESNLSTNWSEIHNLQIKSSISVKKTIAKSPPAEVKVKIAKAAPLKKKAPIKTAEKKTARRHAAPEQRKSKLAPSLQIGLVLLKKSEPVSVDLAPTKSQPEMPRRSVSSVSPEIQVPLRNLPIPDLKLPPDGASIVALNGSQSPILFKWSPIKLAGSYRLEISTNQKFEPVILSTVSQENQLLLTQFLPKGKLYWRLRTEKQSEISSWSKSFSFDVEK